MQYSILLHLEKVRRHDQAIARIVAAWRSAFGPPLFFFSNKGPGQVPDDSFCHQRSVFGRLDQAIGFTLRESRKRHAASLQLFFTNPDRAFYGDLNFIAATIPELLARTAGGMVMVSRVVEFMRAVSDLGELIDASFDHEDVLLQSPGWDILRAVKVAYNCSLGHVAFFNRPVLEAHGGKQTLERVGFTVHASCMGGYFASLAFDPSWPASRIAWHLFDSLEAIGLYQRHCDTRLLHKDFLTLEQIGGFVGAFEAHFGRVFAERYSDGLRPSKSA